MGGDSPERSVSIKSAENVHDSLVRLGHDVLMIDARIGFVENFLQIKKPDIVFNAMHGTFGEDGCIQGLLDFMDIKYTHSGVIGSAIGLNKVASKNLFISYGIRTPNYIVFNGKNIDDLRELKLPFVVKPIANGSSIDVRIINSIEELIDFSGEYIVEEYIHGREMTTGVLGDKYLCPLEIVCPKTNEPYIVDSSGKYVFGEVIHKIPDDLPDHVMEKMKQYTLGAHKACFCEVLSRVDMRYDPITEDLFVLELNTHPGLTKTSLFPDIAKNSGISFDELISEIVSLSMKKHRSPLLISDPLDNIFHTS